jgi:hypothetical protein
MVVVDVRRAIAWTSTRIRADSGPVGEGRVLARVAGEHICFDDTRNCHRSWSFLTLERAS